VKILGLYQGTAYFNFIESLQTESTKRGYAYGLKHFLNHNNLKEPEQILSISLDSLEDMIKKYLVFLTQVHKSSAMARINLAAIKHFCRMNKIKLDWDLIFAFKTRARVKGKDEAYTHDQINQLLSVSDLRLKAIVLIYASTGIRSAALPPMKLKDIAKISEQGIYKFNIYDDELGDGEYFTFCSPECSQAIDQYLDYRERFGEKLTPQSPLIREDFTTTGFSKQKPRHVSNVTIALILINRLCKLGLRDVDHVNGQRTRKKVKIIHGFRKFFETQLLESDVNYVVTKMLMGHDLKLEGNYFRPKMDYIIKEYYKAVDNLTIDPANKLRKKVEKLEVEKSQYDRLAAQLAALEQKIK